MALPTVSSWDPGGNVDLAIDITVSDYDMGEFMLLPWVPATIPVAWRPEISMTARVYVIDSDKTVFAHTVNQKLAWKVWLRRTCNPMAFFCFRSQLNPDDVRHLARKTCKKLLKRAQRRIWQRLSAIDDFGDLDARPTSRSARKASLNAQNDMCGGIFPQR